MIKTSSTYKTLWKDPESWSEVRAVISGEEYKTDRIVSARTSAPLFSGNTMAIGGAVSGSLDLVIKDYGKIPKMAEIKLFYRLVKGNSASEWVQKGVYYIDTRVPDNEAGTLTIRAYDAMLMGEQIWVPDQSLEFPMSHRNTAKEMARIMGITLENPGDISNTYEADYPTDDYTVRQILRFIAAANGGNFVISNTGNLRFIPLGNLPEETSYLVDEGGNIITVGGVRILV